MATLFPKDLLKVCHIAEVQFQSFQQQQASSILNENWFVIYMVSEGKMNLWNVVNEILDKVQWERADRDGNLVELEFPPGRTGWHFTFISVLHEL